MREMVYGSASRASVHRFITWAEVPVILQLPGEDAGPQYTRFPRTRVVLGSFLQSQMVLNSLISLPSSSPLFLHVFQRVLYVKQVN